MFFNLSLWKHAYPDYYFFQDYQKNSVKYDIMRHIHYLPG